MNTTAKFNGRADDYVLGRPNYSTEFIDCLYSRYGLSANSVIADIGSGTGKFSVHLLDRQSEVYCIEPNDDMRRIAETELSRYERFHSVTGDAENTTLPDNFVDFITVAQAFHWFDVMSFKRECLRILKPNGRIFLIWNIRSMGDTVNLAWHDVFSRYCPSFVGFSNGITRDDIKIKSFFGGGYDYVSFDHPLIFDRDGFIKRSLSSSYSLTENDRDYDEYLSALNEIFDKYENNGLLRIANQTVAYIGVAV